MSGQRRLVIIAGVNGSGKSTIANQPGIRALLGGVSTINPDEHTISLRNRHRISLAAANLAAVLRTELEVWRALAENRSVAVETVLSSPKYLPVLRAARAQGYRTTLMYIGLPSLRYSEDRVAKRVAAGGHGVSRRKLAARWPRSLDNFVTFLPEVDDVLLFSNAGQLPELVGERSNGGVFVLAKPDELPEVTRRLIAAGLLK